MRKLQFVCIIVHPYCHFLASERDTHCGSLRSLCTAISSLLTAELLQSGPQAIVIHQPGLRMAVIRTSKQGSLLVGH